MEPRATCTHALLRGRSSARARAPLGALLGVVPDGSGAAECTDGRGGCRSRRGPACRRFHCDIIDSLVVTQCRLLALDIHLTRARQLREGGHVEERRTSRRRRPRQCHRLRHVGVYAPYCCGRCGSATCGCGCYVIVVIAGSCCGAAARPGGSTRDPTRDYARGRHDVPQGRQCVA